MKRKVLEARGAVSTIIASLFFLLLVFSILIVVFIAFFDYNIVIQEQMRIEHERSQEKIVLSAMELDPTRTRITMITISNTGTIDVKIRAIYLVTSIETKFVLDPSAYIAQGESMSISSLQILFEPGAKLIAATERGVKTTEYVAPLYFGPSYQINYNPSRLYIGPLMLQFDAFWYRKTSQDGTFAPNDPWYPGWSIPKGFGYCAWNITVMNIDNRNITINRFSSFVTVPNDSPSSQTCWYLEPTNDADKTQFLAVNQTTHIIFIWSNPKGTGNNSAQKLTYPETTCMVFLTFYGVFHEHDGTTIPYAQTIPFEAAITVIGN